MRFDEGNEFHAPGEPKFFLDYCDSKDRENLLREYEQKTENIKTDLESKWQFYAETKIAEIKKSMELEYEAKLNKAETKIVEMKKSMELEYEAKLNVDECFFKYYYYKWPLFDAKTGDQMNLAVENCSSIDEFIEQFNLALALYAIKKTAKLKDGRVKME